MPDRFDLTYTGEDNEDHQPVMIHRALYGSYERFFMVLIEHFDGDFPLWLAPEQVRILPVSDETLGYAHRVKNELEDAGFRVEVEDRDWTVGRKIRAGHDDRLPYMVIVGEDEQEAGTVSVRDRFENQRGDVDLDAFVDHLVAERDEKRTEPEFVDAGVSAREARLSVPALVFRRILTLLWVGCHMSDASALTKQEDDAPDVGELTPRTGR